MLGTTHPNDHKEFSAQRPEGDGVRQSRRVSRAGQGRAIHGAGGGHHLNSPTEHSARVTQGREL